MGSGKRGLTLWSAGTILVSAFLLFQVQPMVSKMILPWFGGSPAVWTTCMLFFQVFLLAGYLYAHLLDRFARTRTQGIIHISLLIGAVLVLPIVPDPAWKPVDSHQPQLHILMLLAATVGLPYLLLAASAPLVQAWYSRAVRGSLPYRFYALSNLGSLSALLSYPFFIEPAFDIPSQGTLWSFSFGSFAILSGGLAVAMARWNLPAAHVDPDQALSTVAARRPSIPRFVVWLILPAFGTMTLLAVTNQICQDVAVVPFFWVVPLSIYLITFIICFDSDRWYRRIVFSVATILVTVAIASVLVKDQVQPLLDRFGPMVDRLGVGHKLPAFVDSLQTEVILYLVALFCICMVCHGELVRSRPSPRYLTLFYLMIAAGGALGGLFVALVCPTIFRSYVESDICVVGGFLLASFVLLRLWWRRERRWASWWRALFGFPLLIVKDLILSVTRRDADRSIARCQRIFRVANVIQERRSWWTLWSVSVPAPVVAAAVLVLAIPFQDDTDNVLVARRNFYGVLSVEEYGADSNDARRHLYNGRILHGVQFSKPARRAIPTTYYNEESGIGVTLRNLAGIEPLRVATVGLGTGTIAAYGEAGDFYCFYEINPDVIDICRKYFTYLRDCPADVSVQLGDARLSMEREEPRGYDVVALDAFSGDAIPAHLLTIEAFSVYLHHLKSTGVIAVHVSNRHLDLAPIVALIAAHYKMKVVSVYAADNDGVADSSSDWMLVTNNEEFLNTRDVEEACSDVETPGPDIRVWTDHYSNLFQIMTMFDKDEDD